MLRGEACEVKGGLGSILQHPAAQGCAWPLESHVGRQRWLTPFTNQPAWCPHCTESPPRGTRGRQGRGMDASVDCRVVSGSPVSPLHSEV